MNKLSCDTVFRTYLKLFRNHHHLTDDEELRIHQAHSTSHEQSYKMYPASLSLF